LKCDYFQKIIAEPLGLATQGNMDFGHFCYMYKQRFSHARLVITEIKSKENGARHRNKSHCQDILLTIRGSQSRGFWRD
jgi:hypothetical protein